MVILQNMITIYYLHIYIYIILLKTWYNHDFIWWFKPPPPSSPSWLFISSSTITSVAQSACASARPPSGPRPQPFSERPNGDATWAETGACKPNENLSPILQEMGGKSNPENGRFDINLTLCCQLACVVYIYIIILSHKWSHISLSGWLNHAHLWLLNLHFFCFFKKLYIRRPYICI